MKGFKRLAAALGLICLVFSPALVSAQGWDDYNLITVVVDMVPHDSGPDSVALHIDWSDVKGASTYDVVIHDLGSGATSSFKDIPASDSQTYAPIEFDGGDKNIEVIAYDQAGTEIARSPLIFLSVPAPGSVYMGEGSIRFESNYSHNYGNGTNLKGEEGGKITRFYIYQETVDDETGKKVKVNSIYGTGEASMLITHDGPGWHTVWQASGQFSISGRLLETPGNDYFSKCSMEVTLTVLYPAVYQDSCVEGTCVTLLLLDWEDTFPIDDFPALAGATREVSDVIFIEANRTTKFYLDHLDLEGPAACR